jgi:hypothetical protein
VPAAARSTDLQSLGALQTGYFARVPRRLAIVLTDGESVPFQPDSLMHLLGSSHVELMLVRIWGARESIPGDSGYRPDPSSTAQLAILAPYLAGGRIFDEKSAKAAEATAERYLGKGPEARQGRSERTLKLGQFLALAAALPLGFLLWRNRG